MIKLLFFFMWIPSLSLASGIYNPGSGSGGGGSSPMQVTRSGVEITSPTNSMNFNSIDFLLAATGTTAQLLLNPNTTNFVHNQISTQSATLNLVNSGTNGSYEIKVSTTSTFYHLAVSTNGHINTNGTAPVLSSCGTSPSIIGSDAAFTVTAGGTTTGCTITFNVPFNSSPTCIVSERSMSVVNALSYTVSNTAVAISQTGLSNGVLDVLCMGRD